MCGVAWGGERTTCYRDNKQGGPLLNSPTTSSAGMRPKGADMTNSHDQVGRVNQIVVNVYSLSLVTIYLSGPVHA